MQPSSPQDTCVSIGESGLRELLFSVKLQKQKSQECSEFIREGELPSQNRNIEVETVKFGKRPERDMRSGMVVVGKMLPREVICCARTPRAYQIRMLMQGRREMRFAKHGLRHPSNDPSHLMLRFLPFFAISFSSSGRGPACPSS